MSLSSTSSFLNGTDLVDSDSARIQSLITQLGVETNNYCGLNDETKQDYALHLHIAHYLEVESRIAKFKPFTGGIAIKKLESANDKIEFQTDSDHYALGNTEWGQRLESFLDDNYLGGFAI